MAQKRLKKADPLEITIGGFVFSETGVDVVGEPTFEDYGAALEFAKRAHKASGWWMADLLRYGDTRKDWKTRLDQVQHATGLSEKRLKNVRAIGAIEPSRRRDAVEFEHHGVVAGMPEDEQEEWLEKAETEGWSLHEFRMEVRASKRRKVLEGQATLSGQYRILYVDCPWIYNDSGVISGTAYGKAEAHYDGMTIEDLIKLPVAAHALPVSTMFFWVPVPLLYPPPGKIGPHDVATAWGFTYKSNFAWDKVLGNPGHYNHVNHEHLMVYTRGGDQPDVPTPQPKSVIRIRRGDEHSAKPEDIRRMIMRHYTIGPYLELFGREPKEGWSVFGNDSRLWSVAV